MSPSSRASNLDQYREALLQLNTQFFQILEERRIVSLKIQELKENKGRFFHYDPERELALFIQMQVDLKKLSMKELLAFSIVMEDQAMAMAPGSYPAWSLSQHLVRPAREVFNMINPLLLKASHPDIFSRLPLSVDFTFLRDL